ncbi:MAG: site-2 protease family protein [Clostridiales bacterium]|nr:site-2 protease family protein [Clostridiales bacterium]
MFDNLIYFFNNPIELLYYLPVLLFSFALHEWGHAFAAHKNGDDTAKMLGRLTLNPFAHVDIVGLIFLLVCGFGWGKPVPINPRNFKNYKKGMLWVSFAGVLCNLALMVAAVLLFAGVLLFAPNLIHNEPLKSIFGYLVGINLALFIFNLLPIPPLDGSKIVETLFARWLPQGYRNFMNRYGRFVMFGVLFLLIQLGVFTFIFDFASDVVFGSIELLLKAMLGI